MTRLQLRDFRNFSSAVLEPAPGGLTVLQGDNGAGKTSLLEALCYCSLLRSFRGVAREALIRQGEEKAHLSCDIVQHNRRVDIAVQLLAGRRDLAFLNGQRVASARQLVEVLRTTLFTPDDLEIVKAGPAGRRDLIDDAVFLTSPRLGAERAAFERALRQRNALLRQLGGRLSPDAVATLDTWDERLASAGEAVVQARARLVSEISSYVAEAFAALAPSAGPLELGYLCSFEPDLLTALQKARPEDVRRQMTTVGPQRDDLQLSAGGLDARSRLSQGRQRCAALALRLGIHRYVSGVTGSAPVLLLDDAFSELDPATATALLAELPAGQALLTTASSLPPGARPELVVHIAGGRLTR